MGEPTEQLADDPVVGPLLRKRPGLRVPGNAGPVRNRRPRDPRPAGERRGCEHARGPARRAARDSRSGTRPLRPDPHLPVARDTRGGRPGRHRPDARQSPRPSAPSPERSPTTRSGSTAASGSTGSSPPSRRSTGSARGRRTTSPCGSASATPGRRPTSASAAPSEGQPRRPSLRSAGARGGRSQPPTSGLPIPPRAVRRNPRRRPGG